MDTIGVSQTDFLSGEISMTFDLEKNRAAIDSAINSLLCEGWDNEASTVRRLVAEIERLQASLIDLHAEYINTLEKNPGCSAWDLDEQSDADQRRLRKNAAHAISIVEPPIYLQADQQVAKIKELKADLEQSERVIDQQAARIKSLKKEIRRLKHESKVEQEFTNSYILHLHEAEARIKELEADNQNLVTMNKALMKNDWILRDNNGKYRKRSQKAELLNKSLKSKIGPDAKPRVWQITEERKAALAAMSNLSETISCPDCGVWIGFADIGPHMAVLRGMLEESQ